MDIERQLFYCGLGAGVPFGAPNALANAVDKVRFAPDIARRRMLADWLDRIADYCAADTCRLAACSSMRTAIPCNSRPRLRIWSAQQE